MTHPTHVTHVEADRIALANLDRHTAKRLRAAGLAVKRGWFLDDGSLAIERAGEDGRPSRDEEDKLMALARLGIAFAHDPRQGCDPASQMMDLCRSGRFVGTFKQLVWSEKGVRIVVMPSGEEAWLRDMGRAPD